MLSASEGRIHTRLDELVEAVGEIRKDIAVVAASCRDCRPIVMGNGGDGIDKRVDRLEIAIGQTRQSRNKVFWAGVVLISSIVSSIVSGVIVAAASAAM